MSKHRYLYFNGVNELFNEFTKNIPLWMKNKKDTAELPSFSIFSKLRLHLTARLCSHAKGDALIIQKYQEGSV